METPKLISKFNKTNRTIYFTALLVSAGFSVGCFAHYNSKEISTVPYLFVTICSLFFVGFILYSIYKAPKILFYSDSVEFLKPFNLKKLIVENYQIQSWVLKNKTSKYGVNKILYLILEDNKKIRIWSSNYSNFDEIAIQLTRNKHENRAYASIVEKRENTQYAMAAILIGILFLFITTLFFNQNQLTQKDISFLNGHLSEPIKIKKGRKSNSLLIKLCDYKEFNFKVGELAFKETYADDLIKDFKFGDEITISIEKVDFQKSISKEIIRSNIDLIFNYNTISVIEIWGKNFKYLSLEDYNRAHSSNKKWGLGFFCIFGIILISFGVMTFLKRSKINP